MASLPIPLNFTVDLDKGTRQETLQSPLVQGDNLAHKITLTLKRGGEAADLTGAMAYCYVINSSRQTTPVQGSVSGNTVTATLNKACYAVPGRVNILVRISSTDGIIETPISLTGSVIPGTTDYIIDPDDIVPSLDELLALIATMEAEIAASRVATEAASTAADNANIAAEGANTATQAANAATENSEAATAETLAVAARWENLDLEVEILLPDESPTGEISQTEDTTTISLGLPQGRVVNATLHLDDATGILYIIVPNVPQPSLSWAGDPKTTMLYMIVHGYVLPTE